LSILVAKLLLCNTIFQEALLLIHAILPSFKKCPVLNSVLEKAKQEGEIIIKRKDGTFFIVRPLTLDKSPLDVAGIDIAITSEEIVDIIRETRHH